MALNLLEKITIHAIHGESDTECFQCNVCEELFARKFNFDRHMKVSTTRPCEYCNKLFCTLQQHIREYHSSYICSCCGKKFKDEGNLKRHNKGDLKECGKCDKKFCNVKRLIEHIKVHEPVHIECGKCKKDFHQNGI